MKIQLIQYLTSLLLSFQPVHGDNETWEERKSRMENVAQAVEDAAAKATCSDEYAQKDCVKLWEGDKKELAVLLIVQGSHESGFAKNVHEGKCLSYQCDAMKDDKGKTLYHRARSPWQLHKTGLVTFEEYDKMKSSDLDSTKLSAHVAVRYLSLGMKKCKTVVGALSVYAGVNGCSWSGAKYRFERMKSILAKTDKQIDEDVAIWKTRHEAKMLAKKPQVRLAIVKTLVKPVLVRPTVISPVVPEKKSSEIKKKDGKI